MRYAPLLSFVLLGVLAVWTGAQAQPLPVVGEGYGVQVKEGRTSDAELEKIKEAGLSYVRFAIPWYEVEKGRGSYVWGYFDQFVSRLREKGLKAVIIINGGHPSYTGYMKAEQAKHSDAAKDYPVAPASDEAIDAFARFAAKAVEHFGGDDIVWEIWNEPDTGRFWAPHVDVAAYVKLAQETCWAMRSVNPRARIVGPAMAGMPGLDADSDSGFLGPILQSGAADCLDAVSLHPYRDRERPPETVLRAYKHLASFMKSNTPKNRKTLPVVTTEWGFTLADMGEPEQAAYVLRSFLLNSLAGVPLSIWYEWRDSGSEQDDPEAQFGLLKQDRTEKLAYKALQAFLPPLKGAVIEKRVEVGNDEDFVLLLKKADGHYSFVFWSSGPQTATKLLIRSGQETKGQEHNLTSMPQRVDLGASVPLFTLLRPQGLP